MFVILHIRYTIHKYRCFYGWGLLFYLMNLHYSLFDFSAPSVTDLKPVTTKPGQHDLTEYTITIDINTEYFKNDENGKQVFFGVAVCAKSKCEGKVLRR